ncbi:protein phosphatase 2C domain-containing protein [Desulfococcaceae bacterium HSG8]|nr:protein phosphatase 2C domain-containing protein [Desulfococcaceae bacterium HSG8]
MTGKKQNCWEFMKCGREAGGEKAGELGVCPVAVSPTFDGFNMGKNCGRMCWLVAGTFCGGKVQGRFAEKQVSCKSCDFYKYVHAGEGITRLCADEFDISARTHIGLVRKTNEDRYLIRKLPDGSLLLAMADGLGGDVAGDYAAEIVRGRLAGIQSITGGSEEEEISHLVQDIDITIRSEADRDEDVEGMGSTLVCVLLRGGVAYWVHVGDSRLYFLRDGELIQITEDQTFARFLVEEGEITPEQVPTHYSRHVMDQCVGCGHCEPETGKVALRAEDMLILSTDGLHKKVSEETMISLLNAESDLEKKTESLIQAAMDSGGKDNITLLLCKFSPAPSVTDG